MLAEIAQKVTIDRVVGSLVVGILAGLGWLLAQPLSEALSLFLSKIFPLISRQALLQTTAAMLLCTLILASLAIWLTVKLRSKLVPKYGIYWDRQGNAYCPVCQKLISQDVSIILTRSCRLYALAVVARL